MRKNSLQPNNGLSLSQAQSISNLCNQRAMEIEAKISSVNNYSKKISIGSDIHILQSGNPIPKDIVDLLIEKSKLHACQAFLMENIKAKDFMLKDMKNKIADISSVVLPEEPKYVEIVKIPEVSEDFGWEQLTISELNEYTEAEAYASHIGKYIHNNSTLDKLRKELPNIPSIEWIEIETGKKSPVKIEIHHKSEELLAIHESLAELHRKYEQTVNKFKAKVKNLTTEENARIAKVNADAQTEASKKNNNLREDYNTAMQKVQEEIKNIRSKFEQERQANIKEIAASRIKVDERFQPVVDMFLKKLPEIKEDKN